MGLLKEENKTQVFSKSAIDKFIEDWMDKYKTLKSNELNIS